MRWLVLLTLVGCTSPQEFGVQTLEQNTSPPPDSDLPVLYAELSVCKVLVSWPVPDTYADGTPLMPHELVSFNIYLNSGGNWVARAEPYAGEHVMYLPEGVTHLFARFELADGRESQPSTNVATYTCEAPS